MKFYLGALAYTIGCAALAALSGYLVTLNGDDFWAGMCSSLVVMLFITALRGFREIDKR